MMKSSIGDEQHIKKTGILIQAILLLFTAVFIIMSLFIREMWLIVWILIVLLSFVMAYNSTNKKYFWFYLILGILLVLALILDLL